MDPECENRVALLDQDEARLGFLAGINRTSLELLSGSWRRFILCQVMSFHYFTLFVLFYYIILFCFLLILLYSIFCLIYYFVLFHFFILFHFQSIKIELEGTSEVF